MAIIMVTENMQNTANMPAMATIREEPMAQEAIALTARIARMVATTAKATPILVKTTIQLNNNDYCS